MFPVLNSESRKARAFPASSPVEDSGVPGSPFRIPEGTGVPGLHFLPAHIYHSFELAFESAHLAVRPDSRASQPTRAVRPAVGRRPTRHLRHPK